MTLCQNGDFAGRDQLNDISSLNFSSCPNFSTACPWKDKCACLAPSSPTSSAPSLDPAMHDAYEAAPILERLPLQIESIACYSDTLLVGTKQGHLLVYTVRPAQGRSDVRFDVSLERSNKSFSRKPITQLEVVPQYHILISLSDGVISVHDLTVFAQITTINKTKGATLFAIDLQEQTSLSGDVQYTLRMCVAVRRRLQMYYWKNRDFHELQNELGVPDVPRAMAWCKDSLCVGFRRDYYLIEVNTGMLKELFPTGRMPEPTVTQLEDDRLALGKDNMSVILDSKGEPCQKYPIPWNDIPTVVLYQSPYLIAILPKCVEVRTIEPKLHIQSIELLKPKVVCKGSGQIYMASVNYVWRLASMPITTQIKQLLQNKEFELALHLAKMTDEERADRNKRTRDINNLYAFYLFSRHQFEESLRIFAELGTDPSHVIGLYPNLLPQEFRNQLEYPDALPDLEGGELEKGCVALIEFLTQKRNDLQKDITKEMVAVAIVEGNTIIKSRKQLSQIIDTTLLKCYVQTNDALVAPLLRLKDNNCHVEESERVLKKHQKYSELIILYEKKGLHKKALETLLRQSQKQSSQLKGHDRTVQYLQRLGADHLDLIFDFAEWVLKISPEDGLKIFAEDSPEVEGLPRDRVLEYLERMDKSLVIPYLEYIINYWEDSSPEFHNLLAIQIKDRICEMMDERLRELPEGHRPPKAGLESGILGELRTKLILFLETSLYYIPERLLAHFPFDNFFEERAILLGRLGRHEQALAIYVHILQDDKMAKEYCKRSYNPKEEGNNDVFLYLLKMYLSPPDSKSLGVMAMYNTNAVTEPNLNAALLLLEDHANQIDTAKALEILPSTTRVNDVLLFLETVLEDTAARKRSCQILKNLLQSENLQVQEERILYHKVKCVITEEYICKVCKKKIGNSAFARYPNGVIVHYGCCKDPLECPEGE